LRPWRALFVGGAVVVGVAFGCVPDYTFIQVKPQASHCANGMPDPEAGETDSDCGGPDCDPCDLGQNCFFTSDCNAGECLDSFCQMPGCDNHVVDSDETGVDCGGSCKPCPDGDPCATSTDCTSKSCDGQHCAAPTCDDGVHNGDEIARDCGGSTCDGCPVDTPCTEALDCLSAACDPDTMKCVLNCSQGTADCDLDFEVECETNLLTSVRSCGACGHMCALPHATVMCIGGTCQIDTCDKPWERCDIDETNGCETNLNTDVMNCGACGMECPAVNGTPSCVGGQCRIECERGFGDCDEDASNGCETTVHDVLNCLGCGEVCMPPEGNQPFCTDEDGCGYSNCADGRGNCAGDPTDKCANDLTTDVDNCGRCGNACSVAHGTPSCVNSKCVIDSCDAGWDNCNLGDDDGGYSDGCEVNTKQNADNCGSCGNSCDVGNGSGTCQDGSCAVVSCKSGFENCDTTASDGGFKNGCETNLTSDPAHCGGCGNVCTAPHAMMGCMASQCIAVGCDKDYGDCTTADGCETNTSNSIQHCGSCTGTCSKAGATNATCAGGACAAPECDSTHLNCDGNNANGCEATLGTTASCNACPQNGGACTTALPTCVVSGGSYHCQANITVGNSASGSTQSALLSNVTHNLQAGSNRLVLVAVVGRSDSSGASGVAQGRPDTVTYAGVAMTKFDELGGPTNDAANLYYYFLTDTGSTKLPTATGNQAVTIDGTKHTPQPKMFIANIVQFNGVNQATPLVTGARTALGANQTTISSTATVTIAGSVVYTLVGAQYVSGYKTPVDTDLTAPLTLSQNINNVLLAYGGFTAPAAAGPVTISWNWNYAPAMSAQYPVVVQPAQN
jgi:hypothetical protein